MALEDIISALEKVIHGRFKELGENVLAKKDVRETLTTFFAEQQVRPELIGSIKSQSLMYDYLQLELEEREELDRFRQTYPAYLEGEGRGLGGRFKNVRVIIKSERVQQLIFKQRFLEQVFVCFDFYLENRAEGQTFGSGYLQKDKKLKEQVKGLGYKICNNAVLHLKEEGGLNFLIKLASEIRPEIKQYTTFKEVFKIDGINQLLRCFDFYLENRAEGEIFNVNYLVNNKKLNEELKGLGSRTYGRARYSLPEDGGLDKLIELASEVRPEIQKYSDRKEVFKIDGINQLLRCFDFYLENRAEGEIFNVNYLQKDKKLKEETKGLGSRLYANVSNNFSEEGGFNYLVQLAAQQRPEILEHWKYSPRKKA